jgi:hypothetical protein
MILKCKHYARPFERFSLDAFESSIGTSFVAKVNDEHVGIGKLLSANVIEEGKIAELEIEWPDTSLATVFINNEPFSISPIEEKDVS